MVSFPTEAQAQTTANPGSLPTLWRGFAQVAARLGAFPGVDLWLPVLLVWPAWLASMIAGSHFGNFAHGWFMSLTMVVGSFLAGATAQGGGAVAFPAMTLLYGIEPHVARDFSLMIQAVGMNAAALTIVVSRTPVIWRAVIWSGLGGVLGMGIGLFGLAPVLPAAWVKMFFISFWLGFGVALWSLLQDLRRHGPDGPVHTKSRPIEDLLQHGTSSGAWTWLGLRSDSLLLFVVGVVGGAVGGVTGSGLDIVTFSLLTLYFGIDPRVATATSVILMGNNALAGALLQQGAGVAGVLGVTGLASQAWLYWAVCVPVVALGAPLGARFIRGKSPTLVLASLMVVIAAQYAGGVWVLRPSTAAWAVSLVTVVLSACGYRVLQQRGWWGGEEQDR